MKRIYNKPVIEIESFVTEEIMENFTVENVFSYGTNTLGGYGDPNDPNFIRFNNGDGNVLVGIDYSTFSAPPSN